MWIASLATMNCVFQSGPQMAYMWLQYLPSEQMFIYASGIFQIKQLLILISITMTNNKELCRLSGSITGTAAGVRGKDGRTKLNLISHIDVAESHTIW